MYNDLLGSLDIQDYDEEIRDLNWSAILPRFSSVDSITGLKSLDPLAKMLEHFDRNPALRETQTCADIEAVLLEEANPDDKLKNKSSIKPLKK